jgi:hypothetical protein
MSSGIRVDKVHPVRVATTLPTEPAMPPSGQSATRPGQGPELLRLVVMVIQGEGECGASADLPVDATPGDVAAALLRLAHSAALAHDTTTWVALREQVEAGRST